MKRFEKQTSLKEIGIEGQKKLHNANVLIVGIGGLGSPISLYLAAAGVGKIGIVDADIVSESNLQRQILYNDSHIGKKKVCVAKEQLEYVYPNIKIEIYNTLFTKENAFEIAKGYDIIIDGCDNNETRYLMDSVSKELKIPYVYGAISEFKGQVSVFNYKDGISYSDIFPQSDNINSNTDIGVIGALPGIVGSIQAMEAIKIITSTGEVLQNKLLTIDALTMDFTIFEVNL
ncbi:MAG: HesA/MoeB/ThiF family protein [Bacteroidales bacterium]|nr:HesA/MoeB/ThiF family protein [Bacteroidales bacterium]